MNANMHVDGLLVGGWCALLLQIYHPQIASGVRNHSQFKDDSFKRLFRTMIFLEVILNGSHAQKEMIIAWLEKLHRPVRGSLGEEGKALPHFKSDTQYGFTSDLQLWVLSSLVYSVINFNDRFRKPLTTFQKDQICSEIMMIGLRLGIPIEQLHLSHASFQKYFEEKLECLSLTESGIEIAHSLLSIPKRKFSKRLYLLQKSSLQLSLGILPEKVREKIIGSSKLKRTSLPVEKVIRIALRKALPAGDIRSFITYLSNQDPEIRLILETTLEQIFSSRKETDNIVQWFTSRTHRVGNSFGMEEDAASGVKALGQRWKRDHVRKRLQQCPKERLPVHLGVIMDGNRRYARGHGLKPEEGHVYGASKLKDVALWTYSAGIRYLTLWAFSSDNFKRDHEEVDYLFHIMAEELQAICYSGYIHSLRVRLKVIGRTHALPDYLQRAIQEAEEATRHYDRFYLQIAASYGGQQEIIDAARMCLVNEFTKDQESDKKVQQPTLNWINKFVSKLDENSLSQWTYGGLSGFPPVDLIIRTSFEQRGSGFLLWESPYAEFEFIDQLWPDLTEARYLSAIESFSQRNRRFGA